MWVQRSDRILIELFAASRLRPSKVVLRVDQAVVLAGIKSVNRNADASATLSQRPKQWRRSTPLGKHRRVKIEASPRNRIENVGAKQAVEA